MTILELRTIKQIMSILPNLTALLFMVYASCSAPLPSPPSTDIITSDDTTSNDTTSNDTTSSDIESGCSDNLDLILTFEFHDYPSTAFIRAQTPSSTPPAEAILSYSDEDFRYNFFLDHSSFSTDGAMEQVLPLPGGATVRIRLELTDDMGGRRCQEITAQVPVLDPGTWPILQSDWNYENYPRPIALGIALTLRDSAGFTHDRVVLVDQRGRYLWGKDLFAERAIPTVDGLLVLSSVDGGSSEQVLELHRWEGSSEILMSNFPESHHDFAYSTDESVLYTLGLESIPERSAVCGLDVIGDQVLEVDAAGTEVIWGVVENDYFPEEPECSYITDQSISYFNGLSYRDGIVAVSSAPSTLPHSVLLNWRTTDLWESIVLSDRPEASDIPMEYTGDCVDDSNSSQAIASPHGVICTSVSGSEEVLDCLVHNRRGSDICDTAEWIRVVFAGKGSSATCLWARRSSGCSLRADNCVG